MSAKILRPKDVHYLFLMLEHCDLTEKNINNNIRFIYYNYIRDISVNLNNNINFIFKYLYLN